MTAVAKCKMDVRLHPIGIFNTGIMAYSKRPSRLAQKNILSRSDIKKLKTGYRLMAPRKIWTMVNLENPIYLHLFEIFLYIGILFGG